MKKSHQIPPYVSFLCLQDTAIHFPFGDNSNVFGTEKDQAFYNKDGGRT